MAQEPSGELFDVLYVNASPEAQKKVDELLASLRGATLERAGEIGTECARVLAEDLQAREDRGF